MAAWFKDGLNEEELKKEYRRLAKKYHPDINHDPDAEEKMKEINEQFDLYYSNQRVREYVWVDTARAKKEAQKVRATLLVWLLRDKMNPGKFFSQVERQVYRWWFWADISYLKAITNDDKEWDGFRGGLAYCSYGQPNSDGEVFLKKLPAKISPADDYEMYWYNRDHFGDSRYAEYYLIKCRFGTFWAEPTDHGKGYIFYVKCELPEEFLHIGDVDEEKKYSARSIETVYVSKHWIKEAEITDKCTGLDFTFRLFQGITYDEFCQYYDVNTVPQYANEVGVEQIKKDFWFVDDPMVAYYANRGLIKIFKSKRNFRIKFGFFDQYELKQQAHLLGPDDADLIQDYLDKINAEFDEHQKSLIKKGKIKINMKAQTDPWAYLWM